MESCMKRECFGRNGPTRERKSTGGDSSAKELDCSNASAIQAPCIRPIYGYVASSPHHGICILWRPAGFSYIMIWMTSELLGPEEAAFDPEYSVTEWEAFRRTQNKYSGLFHHVSLGCRDLKEIEESIR
jgi:hypothetical protein